MKKYVTVNIVDNDNGFNGNRIMDTYILINPSVEKLSELQEKVTNRCEEDNEFYDDYGAIDDFIRANFEVLYVEPEVVEIEW